MQEGRSLKTNGVLVCGGLIALSELLGPTPNLQWLYCWAAGCVLLLLSLQGVIFRLPQDLPWREQTLRPWFLMNLVFCGYGFLTSIFYWMDLNGYVFWTYHGAKGLDATSLSYAAKSQQIYLIGQVGLVLGLGFFQRTLNRSPWSMLPAQSQVKTLLAVGLYSLIGMYCFGAIPGLSQLVIRSKGLMTISFGLSLGLAYRNKSTLLPMALVANIILGVVALASGWKEEVLVLVLLNGISFFPTHPKLTSSAIVLAFLLGFVVLPPVANRIRDDCWSGDKDNFSVLREAISEIQNTPINNQIDDSWTFLTGRLSEQGLFVRYLSAVPNRHPYYGSQILRQALETPIPRLIWPNKKNTEHLVHERVVELGIVSVFSQVSAKPQYIVDGYLSFGKLGAFLAMFLFGAFAVLASQLCERQLGGYFWGGVFFNGLFSFMWRGACFEFFTNAMVWSVILVFVINCGLLSAGILSSRDRDL